MFRGFLPDCSFTWFLPLLFTTLIHGEMRFACPRPQTPDSISTRGPCGSTTGQQFEDNYMEVTPGPFTIRLEETVSHKGTPIRISLMDRRTNSVPCVLLDHVPHNDASTSSPTTSCKVRDYPLGRCYTGATYLTVDIPDVDCEQCVLQMINIRTDRYAGVPCYQRDSGYNNCTSYYSCANIRIRATPEGRGKGLAVCASYQQSLGERWPYTPIVSFEINLGPPFDSTNFVRLYEKPDWTLGYELQLNNRNVTVGAGSTGIFKGFRPINLFTRMKGTTKSLTAAQRTELHSGAYTIRITARLRAGAFRNYVYVIQKGAEQYQPNSYRDHGVMYSSGGWLAGSAFLGGEATYPQVTRPVGECQPAGSETYGSIVSLSKSVVPRGLVTMTHSRRLLYLHSAVSYHSTRILLSTIWTNATGTRKQVNMGFINGGATGYFVEGAESIGDHLTETSGRFPTRISHVIYRNGRPDVIYGQIQKGIGAVIKSGMDKIGVAFAAFEEETSFNIYVMVSNSTGALGNAFRVTLNGPAISSMTGPVLYNLTDEGRTTTLMADSYFLNATVSISSMNLAQYLWSGLLYINIEADGMTHNRVSSGQLDKLNNFVCEGSMNIACKSHILLSVNGLPVDRGLANVPANGLAAILVGNNETFMDISIAVQDLKPDETVTGVKLLRSGSDFKEFRGYTFTSLTTGGKRQFAHIQYDIPVDVTESLKAGLLSLAVTTSRTQGVAVRTTQIEGRIDFRGPTTPAATTSTTIVATTTARTATTTASPAEDSTATTRNTNPPTTKTPHPPTTTMNIIPPNASTTTRSPVATTTAQPTIPSTPTLASNTNPTSISQSQKTVSKAITIATTTAAPVTPKAGESNVPGRGGSISGNLQLLATACIIVATRRFFV